VPLERVLGVEIGEFYRQVHLAHGVSFRLGRQIERIEGNGRVAAVVLDADERLDADVVVLGVGAVPAIGLLADAGAELADGGVSVDAALRTSLPDVFAAGDIAAAWHPFYETRARVEHWANALNQGPAAAQSMLGREVAYDRLPYFYSDQYDVSMEYTGLAPAAAPLVIRGDVSTGSFAAFWLGGAGAVAAGLAINGAESIADIQALVHTARAVDVARLANPSVPLAEAPSSP
jgi:3-phenylpropionate/trans-cinnamate dioxygenase ferredoxin reductase component